MSLGMGGFISSMEPGRAAGGYVSFKGEGGPLVVALLTGPFVEECRINYDDFISGNLSSGVNVAAQIITGSVLKADIGLKMTEAEKRTFSLDVMFFTWTNNQQNVMKAFKTLAALACLKERDNITYKAPPVVDVQVSQGGKWLNLQKCFVSSVRGEYGPSVDPSGNPYYITANVTILDPLVKTADEVRGEGTGGGGEGGGASYSH